MRGQNDVIRTDFSECRFILAKSEGESVKVFLLVEAEIKAIYLISYQ